MQKVPPAPEEPSTAAPRVTLLDRMTGAAPVRWLFELGPVQRIMSPAQGERTIHKFVRYSMVSGVAIVISQVAIFICTALFHTSGILANTIGALAATPASYELNRKWAWGKHGKSHLWKEVAPFWGLTLLGYLGSTGTVQWADDMCKNHHVIGLTRSLAIMGASLFAYGVVWVVKFFVFQHLVFGKHGARGAESVAGSTTANTGASANAGPSTNGAHGHGTNGHGDHPPAPAAAEGIAGGVPVAPVPGGAP
jgi:putative flippase GtrA